MNVIFSNNAWHYRLQEFVFGKIYLNDQGSSYYYPKKSNLCPYFWTTVFALFFLPLALLGSFKRDLDYHYNRSNAESGFERSMAGLLIAFGIAIVGAVIYACAQIFILLGLFYIFAIAIVSLCIGLIIYSLSFSGDLWIPYVQSVKGKVCPKITWT